MDDKLDYPAAVGRAQPLRYRAGQRRQIDPSALHRGASDSRKL